MTPLGAALAVVLATFAPQAERVESPPPVPEGKVRVTGTAAALDAEGAAHRAEDGTIELAQSYDDRQVVPVRKGRWEALLREGKGCTVVAATLGGRSLLVVGLDELEPPFDEPIAIEAIWLGDVTVHVVATGSGEELDGVEVVETGRDDGGYLHPSRVPPEQFVVSAVRSPFAMRRVGTYWVRAPGRAWAWFDFTAPDPEMRERTIELPESCALQVETTSGGRTSGLTLWIDLHVEGRSAASFDAFRMPLPPDGRIEIDGLPPCRARVGAGLDFSRGRWLDHVVVLGETAMTLSADAPARVELDLAPPPQGLDRDGTIERKGRVVRGTAAGGVPFAGDGTATFVVASRARLQVDDAVKKVFAGVPFGWLLLLREQVFGDASRSTLSADIRGGTFRIRVPYGCWLLVDEIALDGRQFITEKHPKHKVAFDTLAEPMILPWPDDALAVGDPLPFTLRVVDALTKRDLPRVRVVLADHGGENDPASHPGSPAPDDRLVESAASPLHPPLPRGRAKWEAWAGADGYGWKPFELEIEGSATIELDPAADLEVEIANEQLLDGTQLEVRRIPAPGELSMELDRAIAEWRADGMRRPLPFESSTVEEFRERAFARMKEWWEGSAPLPQFGKGDQVVSVPLGAARRVELPGVPRKFLLVALSIDGRRGRHWYAFAPVDASAGGRHRVRLQAAESALPASSPLGGTLFLPPEWGAPSQGLKLAPFKVELVADPEPIVIPVEDLAPVAGTPGLHRWQCGQLMNGTWIASLDDYGFSQPIVLGPGGLADVELVVPPPSELRVQCVDATSGEPVVVDHCIFSLARPRLDWIHYHGRKLVHLPRSSDRFAHRVPAGTIDLELDPDDYAPLEESIVVPPDGADVTLRFWRDLGIHVRWTTGETPIEKRAGYATKVTDSEGRSVLINVPGAYPRGMTLHLSRPGRHRVTFGRLPGFRPLAPIEVDTRAGEYVEVAVELVAER